MLLFDVTRDFEVCCDHLLKERRVERAFIRNHERKQLVLQNLCKQVEIYEKKYRNRIDPRQKRKIIAATAQMFVNAAIKERNEKYLSDAAKKKTDKRIDAMEEMSQVLVETDGQTTN